MLFISGYCSLQATFSPFLVIALCTCPNEAAYLVSLSKSSNGSSKEKPYSFDMHFNKWK